MKILVLRKNYLESQHLVSWIAMNFSGEAVGSSGDLQQKIFPRSAIKMIQVLPFLRKKFEVKQNISEKELACACASHAGEPQHIEVVGSWLQRLNLNENSLHCGAQPPFNESALHQMIRENKKPTRLHNNCSGKHTAMLEFSLMLNAPVSSYASIDHPVQKEIQQLISEMSEEKITEWGIDGCGIPAWRMSLLGFAKMMALFGKRSLVEGSIEENVFKAFTKFPELTSGKEEFCAQAMKQFPEKLLIKVGAEGIMTAIVPEKKIAVVLKSSDGSQRAAQAGIAALISHFSPEMSDSFKKWSQPTLLNWSGETVGEILATL